jgi:hypothetical protein
MSAEISIATTIHRRGEDRRWEIGDRRKKEEGRGEMMNDECGMMRTEHGRQGAW